MVDFRVSAIDQVTLIEVVGRIDSMNANELGETLSEEIERGGRQIVLDLAQVTYMSSAGLRELVAAYRKLQDASGDLRLAQPSSRVQDVLEMSGLDTIFQIFPTQVDAVGSY
ncbi:MAG TPA: STAS domain-containing protein [Phototrophicaceae bacterium]|nr:STAS domain-containing protein [Phototrophicaceae bacterium]